MQMNIFCLNKSSRYIKNYYLSRHSMKKKLSTKRNDYLLIFKWMSHQACVINLKILLLKGPNLRVKYQIILRTDWKR